MQIGAGPAHARAGAPCGVNPEQHALRVNVVGHGLDAMREELGVGPAPRLRWDIIACDGQESSMIDYEVYDSYMKVPFGWRPMAQPSSRLTYE